MAGISSEPWNAKYYVEESIVPKFLRMLLRVSQLECIAPVRWRRVRDGRVLWISPGLIQAQRLIVFIINCLVLCTITIDTLGKGYFHLYVDGNVAATFINVSHMGLPMAIYSIGVLCAPGQIKRDFVLLRQLHKIKTSFKRRHPIKSEIFKIGVLFVFILWQIISLIHIAKSYLYLYISDSSTQIFELLVNFFGALFYQNSVIFFIQLRWSLIIAEIKSTLSVLNDELHSWLQTRIATGVSDIRKTRFYLKNKVNSTKPLQDFEVNPIVTIFHFNDCFRKICGMVRLVDSDDGVLMLLFITLIFLRFLISPYNAATGMEFSAVPLMLCFLHICQLLMIVEPCHQLQDQMDCTRRLLCKLAGETDHWDLDIADLEPFLLQVQMKDAVLAPMKIFTIARPLIASIIGGAATYLIIIIQFQRSPDSLPTNTPIPNHTQVTE